MCPGASIIIVCLTTLIVEYFKSDTSSENVKKMSLHWQYFSGNLKCLSRLQERGPNFVV